MSEETSPADDVQRVDTISAELAGVEAALRRLDDGTYNACEVCGAQLTADVVDSDPLATRCPAHRT